MNRACISIFAVPLKFGGRPRHAAGNTRIKPGDKLRFKIPLPKDEEALRQLLMPTKELIRDALLERAAETGSDTVGGRASGEEGKQQRHFQGVQPEDGDHTYITTAK